MSKCRKCLTEFTGKYNQAYCSEACRKITCPVCQVQFKNTTSGTDPKKQRLYCSKSCRDIIQSPLLSKMKLGKPNTKLRGYKQTPEHLMKRINTGRSIVSSKEELSLVPKLSAMGYEHCGNGTFWVTWKDGSKHNPDFVDKKGRRVFEYFGTYWHTHHIGKDSEIIKAWKEIGYDCIILWDKQRKAFLEEVKT